MSIVKNEKTYSNGDTNERQCKCVYCKKAIVKSEGYCLTTKSTAFFVHKDCKDKYLTSPKKTVGKNFKHGFVFDYKITLYNQKEIGNLVDQSYQQISKASYRFTSRGLCTTIGVDYKLQSAMVVIYDTLLNKRYMVSYTHTTYKNMVKDIVAYATEKGIKDRWRTR